MAISKFFLLTTPFEPFRSSKITIKREKKISDERYILNRIYSRVKFISIIIYEYKYTSII